jgi:double-stranded uracil-DNA glycosylase
MLSHRYSESVRADLGHSGSDQIRSRSMEQGVADLVCPDLRVLFCGINPGTRSGELGLHFARPGNRFWKLLHAGGFTGSVLSPEEQHILPALGIGITNLVARVTAAASELSAAELREGATELESRVEALRPRCLAVLGLQAYRTAFRRPDATIGPQPERIGPSLLWLLPNPSGLQARYQMPEMIDMFKALFVATEAA